MPHTHISHIPHHTTHIHIKHITHIHTSHITDIHTTNHRYTHHIQYIYHTRIKTHIHTPHIIHISHNTYACTIPDTLNIYIYTTYTQHTTPPHIQTYHIIRTHTIYTPYTHIIHTLHTSHTERFIAFKDSFVFIFPLL